MDDLGAWVRLFGGIATAVSVDIFGKRDDEMILQQDNHQRHLGCS